ncbi:MAG: thiamine phosphate synthase [Proteobacteria bacterium]|nr:thiamine phosphate synthase [Pseudomonadota bacterium]
MVECIRDKLSRNPKSEIRNDLSLLYLITDRHQTGGRELLQVIGEALEGGVRLIQLREKDLSVRALYNLALQVRELTSSYDAKLLINDRLDVAMAVKADGVHLPSHSFTPGEARNLLGTGKLIGVSAHSAEDAARAEEEGADFITFSPIYDTPSKAAYGKPQGIERLKTVCNRVDLPIFALGGIKVGNISDVMSAGANGAAIISALMAADDVKKSAKKLMTCVKGFKNKKY